MRFFYRSMIETFDLSPDSFITQVLSARQSNVQIPRLQPGWSRTFFRDRTDRRVVVEPALLPATFNFSRVSQRLKSWGESGGERKWEGGRREELDLDPQQRVLEDEMKVPRARRERRGYRTRNIRQARRQQNVQLQAETSPNPEPDSRAHQSPSLAAG